MTGTEFQGRLDALVLDLQTAGKGKTVNIMFRDSNNDSDVRPLSSDVGGVVNAAELALVQNFIDDLKVAADNYTTELAPVQAARETFNTERAGHQVEIDAATDARSALNASLLADAGYQAAKTALDDAMVVQTYIDARFDYEESNVSENYGALADAKGEYIGG